MSQNLGDVVVIDNYFSQNGTVYADNWGEFLDYHLIANQQMTLLNCVLLDATSETSYPSNCIFEAPKIIIDTVVSGSYYGVSIRNNSKNSLTFNNSSVNFDNAEYDTDQSYIGPIAFTGFSSINITTASNGKTLIRASTLSGIITLDIEDDVQEGTTFSIESENNQLIITDLTGWAITPSTVGNVTTYTLAKTEPVPVVSKYNKKMLRRKLALMLARLKKRKYYCEVEYLESTGTQYIDTGIYPTQLTEAEYRCAVTGSVANVDSYLFGSRLSASSEAFGLAYMNTSDSGIEKFRVLIRSSTIQQLTTSMTASQLANPHTYYMSGTSFKVDGSENMSYTTESFTGSYSLWLFGLNNSGSLYSQVRAQRIYYCKIWDNGVLVRDMIPVLDWDMTPCMYDKVTEQLFYNQGTGSFVAGRQIHQVEYLESTGTQYIDTDTTFQVTDEAYFKGALLTRSNDKFVLSAQPWNDNNNRYSPLGHYSGRLVCAFGNMPTPGTYYTPEINNSEVHTITYKNKVFTMEDTGATYDGSKAVFGGETGKIKFFYGYNAPSVARIYAYKQWRDGELICDFIPIVDELGVGAMFDRVSHTIYDNAGTGAFNYPAREVEYLQSDGAIAIIAGVTVDDTCGYDVKWMALNADDRIIMGTKGSGDSRWVLSGGNNPNVNLSWNTSSGGVGLGLNKIQTAQMNYLNDRKRILNDTPLADITTTLSANASTYNVGIFAGHWGSGTVSLYSTCRIYYAKISKGTGLVRDFVPMFKDGSPCLFDKIGGLYYFGTGTGSFTTGKIVEPEYE